MGYRERDSEESLVIPSGLEEFDKELGAIEWLASSLHRAQRIPSCKRRDALVSALTMKLESADSPTYTDLHAALNKSASVTQIQEREIMRLNRVLEERPIREIVKEVPQVAEQTKAPMEVPPHKPFRFIWSLTKFAFGVLILGFMLYSCSKK